MKTQSLASQLLVAAAASSLAASAAFADPPPNHGAPGATRRTPPTTVIPGRRTAPATGTGNRMVTQPSQPGTAQPGRTTGNHDSRRTVRPGRDSGVVHSSPVVNLPPRRFTPGTPWTATEHRDGQGFRTRRVFVRGHGRRDIVRNYYDHNDNRYGRRRVYHPTHVDLTCSILGTCSWTWSNHYNPNLWSNVWWDSEYTWRRHWNRHGYYYSPYSHDQYRLGASYLLTDIFFNEMMEARHRAFMARLERDSALRARWDSRTDLQNADELTFGESRRIQEQTRLQIEQVIQALRDGRPTVATETIQDPKHLYFGFEDTHAFTQDTVDNRPRACTISAGDVLEAERVVRLRKLDRNGQRQYRALLRVKKNAHGFDYSPCLKGQRVYVTFDQLQAMEDNFVEDIETAGYRLADMQEDDGSGGGIY